MLGLGGVASRWSRVSPYLFLSATTYLLFCHVQPPPRSAVPHVCCRPSNGRKMQALTAVEWLTAVRYETDGRLANGWTDGLPENRLTGLGAGLPLTHAFPRCASLRCVSLRCAFLRCASLRCAFLGCTSLECVLSLSFSSLRRVIRKLNVNVDAAGSFRNESVVKEELVLLSMRGKC